MLYRLVDLVLAKKNLAFFLILFMLGLFVVFPTYDPDLGWHIAYGNYFWQNHKLLTSDIFSWTLADFKWFSISWPYDLLVSLVFPKGEFLALSLIAVAVILLTFCFLVKPFKLSFFWLVMASLVFIFFVQPLASPGFRVQLFELLFLAVATSLIWSYEKGQKVVVWYFPLLMIGWINLHGSFIMGLFLIGSYVVVKNLSSTLNAQQKIVLNLILLLTILAVFINPYGLALFKQIVNYAPILRTTGVNEWQPESIFSDKWLMLLVWTALLIVIVLKNRRDHFGLYQAVIVLLFAFLGFNSRRMITPYVVVSLPLVLNFIHGLNFKISKKANLMALVIIMSAIVNGLFNRLPSLHFLKTNLNEYCQIGLHCSPEAMSFIKKNPLPKKSLTFYNWGGYLIWQTESRVFVDGRMDQWEKEGFSAFSDHEKILQKDDLDLFNKYNFDAVYIPPTFRLAAYLEKQTEQGKWAKVFGDDRAVIFEKKKL
ncbi:hypothetical protein HY030_00985 [Candidatus Gottesmanbacteria bacterium]|nr:hypothetical protein [Candidatus Gottesmanbacteria bacterium]